MHSIHATLNRRARNDAGSADAIFARDLQLQQLTLLYPQSVEASGRSGRIRHSNDRAGSSVGAEAVPSTVCQVGLVLQRITVVDNGRETQVEVAAGASRGKRRINFDLNRALRDWIGRGIVWAPDGKAKLSVGFAACGRCWNGQDKRFSGDQIRVVTIFNAPI